tara:strand:+ start:305 stop:685 length:381 start_codon:yes stop_codon:yes gene_type:complete
MAKYDSTITPQVSIKETFEIVDRGPVGPIGPAGPVGPAGQDGTIGVDGARGPAGQDYVSVEPEVFVFTGLLSERTIVHGLNTLAVGTHMVDPSGQVVYPIVSVVDINSILVAANLPLVGAIKIYKL